MSEKKFEEMEPAEFAGIVDDTIEQLQRQLGPDDALARQMLSRVKAETRRRLLEQTKIARQTPIGVRIVKRDLTEVVFSPRLRGNFHATPYAITLTNPDARKEGDLTNIFFSASEAASFLEGLRAAHALGLPFEKIPDIKDVQDWHQFPEDTW